MFGLGMSWLVMGICMLLVQGAGVALYWQVFKRREALASLQNLQAQLKQSLMRVYQQEDEIRGKRLPKSPCVIQAGTH